MTMRRLSTRSVVGLMFAFLFAFLFASVTNIIWSERSGLQARPGSRTPSGSSSAKKTKKVSPRVTALARPENRPYLYALDAAIPGYASFSMGDYWAGSLFAAGRAITLFYGLRARNQHLEYKSVQKAALAAEVVYGPGLRFQDPYNAGFRTADEFRRLGDRRAAVMSLNLTLHLALIVGSLLYTGMRASEIHTRELPVFEQRAAEQKAAKQRATGFHPVFALDTDVSPGTGFAPRLDHGLRLRVELIRRDF